MNTGMVMSLICIKLKVKSLRCWLLGAFFTFPWDHVIIINPESNNYVKRRVNSGNPCLLIQGKNALVVGKESNILSYGYGCILTVQFINVYKINHHG